VLLHGEKKVSRFVGQLTAQDLTPCVRRGHVRMYVNGEGSGSARNGWTCFARLVSRGPHSHSQGVHRRSVALGTIVRYYLVQYVASYLNRKEMIFSLSCVGIVGG
jgi:hypothetical protein